jgi:hypothetical protein
MKAILFTFLRAFEFELAVREEDVLAASALVLFFVYIPNILITIPIESSLGQWYEDSRIKGRKCLY